MDVVAVDYLGGGWGGEGEVPTGRLCDEGNRRGLQKSPIICHCQTFFKKKKKKCNLIYRVCVSYKPLNVLLRQTFFFPPPESSVHVLKKPSQGFGKRCNI